MHTRLRSALIRSTGIAFVAIVAVETLALRQVIAGISRPKVFLILPAGAIVFCFAVVFPLAYVFPSKTGELAGPGARWLVWSVLGVLIVATLLYMLL